MKVFYPQNIQGGFLSDKIPIGPVDLSIIQLGLLGLWATVSMLVWKSLIGAGLGKAMSFVLVLPVIILFLVVTFFRFSEMNLLEFVAKLLRTNFFDSPKKYQVNYKKVDPVKVKIQKLKKSDKSKKIEKKKWIRKKDIDDLKGIV